MHGENSLSLAGAVNTTDPDLLVSSRAHRIDRGQLDHIFDPFFTTNESGLGLGLAVCRSIILAHKGRRWTADNSDRGAAFNFTLPVTTGEGQQ